MIDAHVHVASDDTATFPLRSGPVPPAAWWRSPLPVEVLLGHLDRCGVDGAVLVHAFGAYANDCRYVVEATGAQPARTRAVVGVDMATPASIAAIDRLAIADGVSALRVLALDPSSSRWLGDGGADALFDMADRLGRPIIVCARAGQLLELRPSVAAHPHVAVTVDDCGVAELDGDRIRADHPILSWAELPNVSVKVFSPMLAAAERQGSAARLLDQVVGVFGAQRVAWGSNFPQSGVAEYSTLVDIARGAVASLPGSARDAVLGDTAARLWFSQTH